MSTKKEQFRTLCKKKLTSASKNRCYHDSIINSRLLSVIKEQKKVRSILFYIPMGFEADITKTLQKVRKKYQIFTPFMQGKSFKMVPYRLPLKRKKFGILEAGKSYRKIKKIDIAIVPVIGIDKQLKRVGFGKGMYDRFFETLKEKPYTIFVQRKLCYSDEKLCEDHDIECDMLITSDIWLKVRR